MVAAISASLMALLLGLFALGIYLGLVQFGVTPNVSHFNLSAVVVFAAIVFVLTLPIETVYARQRLFSEERPFTAKSDFLLFPVALAVAVWRRL